MAVSFKVPASPKRNIFNIDSFLGVDLTNTGSNIDEVRSPNAENMIRYVPGKVRKRMGYSVPVEFSTGQDVNRALGTSEDWIEVPNDGTEVVFDICTDGSPITKPYSYIEIFGIGTFQFGYVCVDDTRTYWTRSGTVETPYDDDFWGYAQSDLSANGGIKSYFIKNTSLDPDDEIRVKGLRIFRATKYSFEEFEKSNKWKPAPEDNGNVFILTPTTDTVYGRHVLKTGKKQGDFVTDVNRALGTSSTFQSFPDQIVCQLGETIPKGKQVHISFDYQNATSAVIYQGLVTASEGATYIDTLPNGAGTFSKDFTADLNFVYISINNTTTEIKNLMVTYAKSASPTWDQAPEDKGLSFEIGDVYQRTGDNVGIFNSLSDSQVIHGYSDPATDTFDAVQAIQQSTTAVKGELTIIDFDLSMTVSNHSGTSFDIKKYRISLFSSDFSSSDHYMWFDGQPSNQHITLYVKPNAGNFFDQVRFDFITTTSISGTAAYCDLSMNNLKVYQGIEKTDFWSPAYINLFHVGQKLYVNKSGETNYDLIYSNMNQHRSVSWQFEARDNESAALGYDNLYIIDGKTYLEYNGAAETINPVDGNGKIPLVTYAKAPSGGGSSYYAINRLQPGFEEQFIGDGTATRYQLSFGNLDTVPVRAWVKDRDEGYWLELAEGTDFTVNYGLGSIDFTTAPWDAAGTSGEDNVRIRAFRTVQRYADSINKCTFGTLFGVGGTSDRLFLSGNSDYPNYDFYSDQYDPTYFPDVNYSTLGVSSSEIKGYARVNNYLATFKDENEPSQSVFIREGDWVVDSDNNGSAAFKLINTLQGNGAISPYTFGYLQTEPLFLTKSGIFAITAQDITGEKYGQARSFYLNGSLLKENDLDNAFAVVYDDMYILALNGHLYCLDGLQPTRTDPQMPYATRQYVGYYCTNINANVMWTYNDALWFGTTNGKVCKFYTDIEDLASYNDDGDAIYCCWETPDLDGKLFYKNKTFRYFAIRMMKALRTSVSLYGQKKGTWMPKIKEDVSSGVVFDFNNIDFALFSFSTDRSEKVVHTKVRIKKVDKARFKVENDKLNEPFGLFDLALEYIESGNYKG